MKMNSTILIRKIGGTVITLAMMAGTGIATNPAAQAQWRNDGYGRNGRYNDDQVRWPRERTKQYAYLLGYHNAYTEGKEAAGSGYRISYKDVQEYRAGTNGWLAWMGYLDSYKDSYRKGFEDGFKDGQSGRARRYGRDDVERALGDKLKNVYGGRDDDYDNDRWRRGRDRSHDDGGGRDRRGGRYDRNEVYRIAQQNGYREGFHHGEDDRSHRRGYDYDHSSTYREATKGYGSEYGDRGVYQQGFRDGYRRGYDDGFRGRANNSGQRWPLPWPF
jgi:hypothetical protein